MGKLLRTVILSVLFVGAIVFLIIASGSGPQVWAIVQPVVAGIAVVLRSAMQR